MGDVETGKSIETKLLIPEAINNKLMIIKYTDNVNKKDIILKAIEHYIDLRERGEIDV